MAQGISGSLKVSNDCIADLAGYAALECYGVIGMAVTDQQEVVLGVAPRAAAKVVGAARILTPPAAVNARLIDSVAPAVITNSSAPTPSTRAIRDFASR